MPLDVEERWSILSACIDSTDEIVLVLDAGLRILLSNRRAKTLLGFPSSALEGRSVLDVLEPGSRSSFLRFAKGSRKLRSCRTVLTGAGGARHLVDVNLTPFSRSATRSPGYVFVGHCEGEVASPRRTDATNGLAARMLKGCMDPVFLIDAHTRKVRDCNQAALDILGYRREELVGRRLLEHGRGEEERRQAKKIEAEAWHTYETAGIFQTRIEFPGKDGERLPCDVTGMPFFGSDGSLDSIIAILVDRSGEVAREAELSKLIKQVNSITVELSSLAKSHTEAGGKKRLSSMGFTSRQIEILRLAASGASSKEIGFSLGIAESTVKNHLSAIYRKLGVKSKVGCIAAITARQLRLE